MLLSIPNGIHSLAKFGVHCLYAGSLFWFIDNIRLLLPLCSTTDESGSDKESTGNMASKERSSTAIAMNVTSVKAVSRSRHKLLGISKCETHVMSEWHKPPPTTKIPRRNE